MAAPRLFRLDTPLDKLKAYFAKLAKEQQIEEKRRLIASTHKLIEKDVQTRMFDEFPLLLPAMKVAGYERLLEVILKLLTKKPADENGIPIVPPDLERQIKGNIYKDIVKLACHGFLQRNTTSSTGGSEIKPELIKLLQWEDYRYRLDTYQIISAFVNESVQELINADRLLPNSNRDITLEARTAITNLVNKNCHDWIIEASQEAGFQHRKPIGEPSSLSLTALLRNPAARAAIVADNHMLAAQRRKQKRMR